jgi:hypothetical protein
MGNTLVVPMSWIPGWVSAMLRSAARPGLTQQNLVLSQTGSRLMPAFSFSGRFVI